MQRIILKIGDIVVSDEPARLETVLGSCVSVCLWDEKEKIGGMNHFMLPEMTRSTDKPTYCGSESIKILLNNMLMKGAVISHLKAKLFGGGRLIKHFNQALDVGRENVRVAKKVLKEYEIPIISELTGHDSGIKILFYTKSGRVFVKRFHEEDIKDTGFDS